MTTTPFIKRDIATESKAFHFTVEQRIKACYWLSQKGFYIRGRSPELQGNNVVIRKMIYDRRIIDRELKFELFEELWLEDKINRTEYRSALNEESNENTSNIFKPYIYAIKLLNTTCNRNDCSQVSVESSRKINAARINEIASVRKVGRTPTLPAEFTFDLFRKCYEFTKENQGFILNSVLNVLKEQQFYKCTNFEKVDVLTHVDDRLIELGVKSIPGLSINVENRHPKIRDNETLFDLYDVLMGGIQVLIGSIMARRQDELIKLKSHGNLHPEGVDPYSEKGLETNFGLVFKVKKTGVGGKKGANATIRRPIVNSIARLIWTLEQFNIKAIEAGTLNEPQLFNIISKNTFELVGVDSKTYNNHLDSVCDYFETDLIYFGSTEYRRIYARQHQFRRFFAMCFFWSKGYDGLDTLRWMLGHSDMEHLYHYISESESGAVLSGAKASVIVKGILDKKSELSKLQNIDKLEALIAKRFNVKGHGPVMLSTLIDAVEDYDDENYVTKPSINQLKAEQELESQVLSLLEDKTISLEPNFFTIQDENGKTINTFNLVLEVNEVE